MVDTVQLPVQVRVHVGCIACRGWPGGAAPASHIISVLPAKQPLLPQCTSFLCVPAHSSPSDPQFTTFRITSFR